MLLAVAGAVYGFERREIIRQTWGKYAETENVKVNRLTCGYNESVNELYAPVIILPVLVLGDRLEILRNSQTSFWNTFNQE